MTETMLALNANWTDPSQTATLANASNTAAFTSSRIGHCVGGYWYPWYDPFERRYPNTQTLTITARPIRLTMSEVERLRVAAKKDKDLRATLAKFTDHIEVVVDFE